MKRKRRKGEVVCRCGAYRLPHRALGGNCDGGHVVYETFENNQWGECRGCNMYVTNDEGVSHCQVLEGLDKLVLCPALQEFIRYNEIRLYGVNADAEIENPRRRR